MTQYTIQPCNLTNYQIYKEQGLHPLPYIYNLDDLLLVNDKPIKKINLVMEDGTINNYRRNWLPKAGVPEELLANTEYALVRYYSFEIVAPTDEDSYGQYEQRQEFVETLTTDTTGNLALPDLEEQSIYKLFIPATGDDASTMVWTPAYDDIFSTEG
jgi:hypothetical protein